MSVENKFFCFVLVHFNKETIHLSEEINQIAMDDFDCDGVEEFSIEEQRVDEILGERAYSGGDIPTSLIDEVMGVMQNQEEMTFKYFFYQKNYEERAESFLSILESNFEFIPRHTDKKPFEDWNLEWKKFYSPIIVSDKLEIIPEWLKDAKLDKNKDQVFIYPGMGFGTGTHQTTYLCLKLFSEIQSSLKSYMKCLDFGCGSGILGIAAIKTNNLGVVFCDIDRDALDNCLQNLQLNFDGQDLSRSKLILRERLQVEKCDLVFANILEQVLISEKNIILDSLNPGGVLIVSGLLNHQVPNILSQYGELEHIKTVSSGDWSAVLFRNKK